MTTMALTVQQELTPAVWEMLLSIGTASKAARTLGVMTAEEAAIKLLFCWENGLPLTAANNGLYIVNGRIAAQTNIIAAQLRRHPDYDYEVIEVTDKGATVAILRRNSKGEMAEIGRASFTEADASRAGLLAKDNWKGYPDDLYFARALSRAQRRYAPDVFMQPVYTPEELNGNVIDATGWTVEAPRSVAPATPAVTLADLVERHGPEAVMQANGGAIPGTDDEVQAVAAALDGAL